MRMTYHGADELADKLMLLGEHGTSIAKAALYDGAAVVADAIHSAVGSLPSVTTRPFDGVSDSDREDLAAGIGIAKFAESADSVDTAISFNGYARRTEARYPNGVPLAMIARSLESGSSLRQKHPFVRPAAQGAKAAALAAMAKKAEEEVNKIMEG